MKTQWLTRALVAAALFAAVAGACSAGSADPVPTGNPGSGGSPISSPDAAPTFIDAGLPPDPERPGTAPPRLCDVCTDFPAEPILVEGTPPNAADLFGAPDNVDLGAGPCIAEPQPGTLLPNNWLRPRIRWTPAGDLYEVRISTERQEHDLVAYTPNTEYYIPREVWNGVEGGSQGLARNNYEEDIVVTVRAVNTAAPGVPVGSQTVFRTAAVDAGGCMVYWATISPEVGDNSYLMGFCVGDEAAIDTLHLGQLNVQTRSYAAEHKTVECIGCHTSTPDGDAVAFNDHWPWAGVFTYVTEDRVGDLPDYVTPAGLLPAQQMWLGVFTFSPAHWGDGRRLTITSFGNPTDVGWDGDNNMSNQDRLMWVNLAAAGPAPPTEAWQINQQYIDTALGQSFGFLARAGDPRGAVTPDWSHDGVEVAYTSTSTTMDGHVGDVNDTDIYVVPFNNGAGGDATPVAGAAQTSVAEYYPAFSTDDAFIAFNRVNNPGTLQGWLYYRPEGEIWIAAARGRSVTAAPGETAADGAIRLRANDPNTCSGEYSPGSINSWAKWSPRVNTVNGKTYYWLIFSSAREATAELPRNQWSPPDTRFSQLYMAAFTVEDGVVTTYPAVYLWNQGRETSNLTPAWDEFDIPEVPVPEIPR